MILDHVGLAVTNYDVSKEFYSKALAPLGIELVMEVQGSAGYGRNQKPEFWFAMKWKKQQPIHVAFAADTREQVREFYRAALDAGAQDNGAPGIRGQYHPTYYAAFILDPDGHNIEAVCHRTE